MMHNKNIDALHQHVAKEILPQEYGGCGDSIQKSIGLFDSQAHQDHKDFICLKHKIRMHIFECVFFLSQPIGKIKCGNTAHF